MLLFPWIISLHYTQKCIIKKRKFSNPAFVNVRERLNMIHPLWRTMVNFPLILLNAELKVQVCVWAKVAIVLVLGKDTTKHCNVAPLMANEWAGGNSSWQLWIGMFSGLGVNVVKWVSQNNGHIEARTSFQPSNQKEKPTLTYKVSLSLPFCHTSPQSVYF